MKNLHKLKEAVLAVTYQCNLRCQMCHIWQKSNSTELPREAYLKLPKNLKEINISGGEPFLKTDLEEVVFNIVKSCPEARIIFSTNGYATEIIIEKLKEILKITRNIGVAVSLDGLEKTHDKIRGIQGSFQKAILTINKLKEIGLKPLDIKIAFTLSDDNASELKDVYQLSRNLNIDFTLAAVHNCESYFSVTTNKLIKLEEIKDSLEYLVNQELKSSYPKKWARAFFTYGLWFFIKNNKRLLPDYSGQVNIFIDPSGNIFNNDVSNQKIGYLNKEKGIIFDKEEKDIVPNWMICTVRPAIKKHWLKVLRWVLRNKIRNYVSL